MLQGASLNCDLTLAFLRTCPRTGEAFWRPCCRRSRDALLTGREQDSVSLVSQLEKGEHSWAFRITAGDYNTKTEKTMGGLTVGQSG